MRTFLLALLLLGSSSCTLALNYNQCSQDSDCPLSGDQKQFCTSDNICVTSTPLERLCTQTYPTQPAQNAIPLGALLDLPSDPTQPNDTLLLRAVELAIDEINDVATSTVARPLVLYICDISNGKTDAINSMGVLATTRQVVGVLGPTNSAAVPDVIDIAASTQVPLLSPSASASALRDLPNRGFFFRIAPSDSQQGPVLSTLVPNGTNLALMSVQSPYGESVRQEFLKAWTARNTSNMVSNSFSFSPTNPDKIAMATASLVALKPQYVLLIGGDNAPDILKQLTNLPLDPNDLSKTTQIVMTDDAKTNAVLALSKGADSVLAAHLGRVFGIAPQELAQIPEAADFQTSYKGKFAQSDLATDLIASPYITYSYDALYVLAMAAASIPGTISGTAMQGVLRGISDTKKQVSVGPSAYLASAATIAKGDPLTINGITGPIRFGAEGDRVSSVFEQWKINTMTGKFVTSPISQQ